MDLLMDWLSAPLVGQGEHHIAPWAMWHARSMVLAWGFLLPLGALAARFFKVLPGQNWPAQVDHTGWWHVHRAFQWAGFGLMLLGLYLVDGHAAGQGLLAQMHAWVGWFVVAVGTVQVAGGLIRGSKGGPTAEHMRGDHYDMTPWRLHFERLHKFLGWLALVASIGVIAVGLLVVNAPRWMALVLGVWWVALAFAFAWLQRSGRCIDTYQAIWGPDPAHPGNRRKPIGWGIRRPLG